MNKKRVHTLPRAVVICGPTGIGKTSFSIELARRFNGQIIGADSMQIYRRMDTGTAKPTPDELTAVVHHMVNIVDPDEHFDAQKYATMAYVKVLELSRQNILPFIVGGTGLYIKSLIYGLFETQKVDEAVRRRLKKDAEEQGGRHLYEQLKDCDPVTAGRIHENDTYRIIRALEVYETTRRPLSESQQSHRFKSQRIRTLKIGLCMERAELYQRIDSRIDFMIQQGLPAEVKSLLEAGYSPDLNPMKSLGYRHMVEYITGVVDWDEALRTLKRDTRRYAKRQMTWFNADPEIIWMEPNGIHEAESHIKTFLL